MAWLDFLTTTGLATATQADLQQQGLAVKMTFDGEMITQLANYDEVEFLDITGAGAQRCELKFRHSSNKFFVTGEVGFSGPYDFGSFATFAANFTPGTFYIFFYRTDEAANATRAAFYEMDGTLIGAVSAQNYETLNIGTSPVITIGRIAAVAGDVVRIDAVAIYADNAPDETSKPSVGDTDILALWFFDEGTGATLNNEVAGGADLTLAGVAATDYSWETGGQWDAGGGGGGPPPFVVNYSAFPKFIIAKQALGERIT